MAKDPELCEPIESIDDVRHLKAPLLRLAAI